MGCSDVVLLGRDVAGDFFGEIDADRAPRDAAPAADAAGAAELVLPRGPLVGYPLAVASF